MQARKFITFEGGEGSGKSTQALALALRLRRAGVDVVLTREPGGSPFAERVRELVLDPTVPPHVQSADALLFIAARADHLASLIEPALSRGAWVVCDRFSDSTRVYQGLATGAGDGAIQAVEAAVLMNVRPSLTFVLDVSPDVGLARARQRSLGLAMDAYESRDGAFHERVRQGFLAIARAEPGRCVVIDGGRDEAATGAAVWDAFAARFKAPP